MIITRKIRLVPTSEQELKFIESSNVSRWAYNYTLKMINLNYKFRDDFLSEKEFRKYVTKIKKRDKYSWLNNVSNNVIKQSIKDCYSSFRRFFKGQSGFPKPKKKFKTIPSFYVPNDKIKFKENNTVLIEKIGWVKHKEKMPIGVKYYNPRIKYDGKYWYLTIGINKEKINEPLTDRVVGIDLGIKKLAVTSDGIYYKNINKTASIRKIEKRLKRLQKRASKKYIKGKPKSSNLISIEKKIKKIHRRLSNIRNNHIQQITTEIVKTKPSKVVVEDLNISGMMKNKKLSKAIQNQKFYYFLQCLEYKCELRGIEFVKANRYFPSSKLCNNCGEIKKDLKLKDRIYQCSCGYVEDRDLNASYNLRDYKY